MRRAELISTILVGLMSASCGDSEGGGGAGAGAAGGGAGGEPSLEPDPQTPPQSAAAVASWIAEGHYQGWHCEPESHEARPPSPHGVNRVCSNDLASAHGSGEYPVGAASVKELFDDEGTNVVGHAVSLHVSAGPSGATWYWYEQLTSGVVADGLGDEGTPRTVCVGCHQGAGSDAAHSGHDLVYTQVE